MGYRKNAVLIESNFGGGKELKLGEDGGSSQFFSGCPSAFSSTSLAATGGFFITRCQCCSTSILHPTSTRFWLSSPRRFPSTTNNSFAAAGFSATRPLTPSPCSSFPTSILNSTTPTRCHSAIAIRPTAFRSSPKFPFNAFVARNSTINCSSTTFWLASLSRYSFSSTTCWLASLSRYSFSSPTFQSAPPPAPARPLPSPPVSPPPPEAPSPTNDPTSPPPPVTLVPSPPSPPGIPPSDPTPSVPPSTPSIPTPPSDPNSTQTSNSTPGSGSSGNVISSGGGGIKTGTAVGIGVAVSLIALSLIGIVLWSAKKRKKHAVGHSGGYANVLPSPFQSSQMSDSPFPRSPTTDTKNSSGSHGLPYSPSDPGLGYSKSLFTYEELSHITNHFSTQNLLGEGGFGCVYKGYLSDGRVVAVKQLKDGGGQGEREFRAEVEIISRIHHRHLVSLVGYCIAENQRLLVYDYVPNDTLHYHLHGAGRPVMDWSTRLKVALGAARGLAYLHEDCHPRVIHRDIKSSNILLDYSFEAQVSDFGLAKLAMDANTHVTTRVMGTFGYLAPEYASSGKLTDKSDVFSFGVVLLELVTGRKPVDTLQPLGDESLVEWARPIMSRAIETGEFKDLPDPRLENDYNEVEMFRMIEVAAACVRHSAPMRPRMGQVVRALDGLGDSMDLHNGTRPGQSELFNSAQQSAEIRLFQRMAFGSQDYSSDFSQTNWRSRRDL
ncbi:hypothetical protein Taro_044783 [Colocasia esculenta]|uniref:non-specific serine/threonine protein kinase n=1 Tax=Colocasia esculenta TaxID=4460 RepID=A0A843X5U2_COLES|nr:hypothetical protein [Colocasia esculenta]